MSSLRGSERLETTELANLRALLLSGALAAYYSHP